MKSASRLAPLCLGVFVSGCGSRSLPHPPRHTHVTIEALESKNEVNPLAGERIRLFVARFLLDLELESPKILGKLDASAEFRTENSERRGRLAHALDRSFKRDGQGKNHRLRFDLESLHAIQKEADEPIEYFGPTPVFAFAAPYRVETSSGSGKPGLLEVGVIDLGERISVVYLENERGELE